MVKDPQAQLSHVRIFAVTNVPLEMYSMNSDDRRRQFPEDEGNLEVPSPLSLDTCDNT